MLPMIKPILVDGLANLLGAGRPYGTLIFIKTKAGILELQPAVLEERAHLGLGILDQALVGHPVYPARANGIKMRHEIGIVAIVAAQIGERIGKILAARKVLLERRKATAQRMTPGVDDLRIWQNHPDESDMGKIVRHLVDEVRRAGFALHPRVIQILLAQVSQLLWLQGRDAFGIA